MIYVIIAAIFGPLILIYIIYGIIGLIVVNDAELSRAWADGRIQPERILQKIFAATYLIVCVGMLFYMVLKALLQ